jgi:hypothetical protein
MVSILLIVFTVIIICIIAAPFVQVRSDKMTSEEKMIWLTVFTQVAIHDGRVGSAHIQNAAKTAQTVLDGLREMRKNTLQDAMNGKPVDFYLVTMVSEKGGKSDGNEN